MITRVIGHDDTTQKIRHNDKVLHNMNWGGKDAQVVPKCVGKIKKSWHYYPTGITIKEHKQFVSILTCRVEAADQRTERERRGKVNIYDDDAFDTGGEESDSEADDDGT